jgi:hypothetical protein
MKIIVTIALSLMCAANTQAQGTRFGDDLPITTSTAGSTNIQYVSSALISIYNAPCTSLPCSTLATTYTDSTLATACPTSAQIVIQGSTSCTPATDPNGNWGAWIKPGQYCYSTTIGTSTFGPFCGTAPASSSAGTFGALTLPTQSSSSVPNPPSGSFTIFADSGTLDLNCKTNSGGSCVGFGTNLIPANNTWTGTNAFNAGITTTAITTSGNVGVGGPNPWYDVTANGMVCNESNDDTAAFNDLTALACTAGGGTLWIPPAHTCNFEERPTPIHCGLNIAGVYSKGAAFGYGSFVLGNYTETTPQNGLLTWDGSNAATEGNGGGVFGINIQKASGQTGGTGIELTGTNCTSRSGNFHLSGVKISGTGTWNYGLYIDGSTCTTSGTQGNRDNYFEDLDIFGTTTLAVGLLNCVHCYFDGLETSLGSGSDADVHVDGSGSGTGVSASQDVHISNSEISGNYEVLSANNVTCVGCNVTGTVASSSNATNSFFDGIAAFYTPVNGLPFIGYDPSSASSQNQALTQNLRAVGTLSAGGINANCTVVGEICSGLSNTSARWLMGLDGNGLMGRANGSGAGTEIFFSFDALSTTPFTFDNSSGFATTKQITSTLATGTAPLAVSSTTPVSTLTVANHPTIEFCGTTTTCSKTAETGQIIVFGQVSLSSGSPSTATITSLPYTSSATYYCTATEAGGVSAVKIVNSSGSSTVITGPNTVTDPINYICVGS